MWSVTARITLVMSFLTLVMNAARAAQADPPQASGKPAEKKTPDAAPAWTAGAGGLVVFIDPVTRRLVQPAPEDIAKRVAPQGATVAHKAPVTFIYGPGSTVGMAMPRESFSYAIATITAEGKLTLDCVVGDKAANDRIAAGQPRNGEAKAKGSLDEKR